MGYQFRSLHPEQKAYSRTGVSSAEFSGASLLVLVIVRCLWDFGAGEVSEDDSVEEPSLDRSILESGT